jgi:hypothetical protein
MVVATDSGTAHTTGLVATDVVSSGTQSGPIVRSRCSQVDESGIHTSGTLARPPAWPTPSSVVWWALATAAATSAGSVAVTSSAMQRPSTLGDEAAQVSRVDLTAGAMSGAAATERGTLPLHDCPLSSR